MADCAGISVHDLRRRSIGHMVVGLYEISARSGYDPASIPGRAVTGDAVSRLAMAERIVEASRISSRWKWSIDRSRWISQVTKPASRGIGLISRRVFPCRRRLPREGVGRIHSGAMTAARVQAGGRNTSTGEIIPVAALAGTEACRGLCGCSVSSRVVPAGSVPYLAVAKGIIEAARRPGYKIRWNGDRRQVGTKCMTIGANCCISCIRVCMRSCTARTCTPRRRRMRRIDRRAMTAGRVQTSDREASGKIRSMAVPAVGESRA